MDPTIGTGILLTAGFLGFTHGIEPDHVAGITALTHEAADSRLSALVGGCFAAGHVILVVVWITLAYMLLGTTSFPPAYEQFGLLFIGIILSLLSLVLGIRGVRKLGHKHVHDHGDGPHAHFHVHLPATDDQMASTEPHSEKLDHDSHSHSHGILSYIKIGTVGALFTLSPPISMIGFISVTMSETDGTLLIGIIATYATIIIATMAVIGGGAGSFFRLSKSKGERFHGISQILAAVLVLAFGINLLIGVVPGLLS